MLKKYSLWRSSVQNRSIVYIKNKYTEQINSKENICTKKLTKQIADDLMFHQYDKLYQKYGQGMAHISRKSCSHCYTQLPPQTLVEIEYDKKVITCPSCSVFLYHKNDND